MRRHATNHGCSASAGARRPRLGTTALAFAATFGCNTCEPPPQPAQGNIDRPGDVVVVTPPDQDHTYAIISNPEIEQLRVFDVTLLPEGGFVRAPNVFFPLSILTGPATSDLSAPKGLPSRVLALDSADDELIVIRTVAGDGEPAFTRVGEAIAVSDEPAAMDAALIDDALVVFVSLPEAGAIEAITLDPETAAETARELIALPEGARPGDVAVDPTGTTVVVTDAVKPTVALVHVADGVAAAEVRTIDVGGPTRRVAVGQVELPDGYAPVAVVLRRDASEIAALRLYREGFREERYALLGRAEMPGVPTAAYVPDAFAAGEAAPVVCCQGLRAEHIEAGESTPAWAAVAAADGIVYYVSLAAPSVGDGPRVVRTIDANEAPPGASIDPNTGDTLWIVPAGATSPRPVVTVTASTDFGSPPFVPYLPTPPEAAESLLLTWEGALPGLRAVPAEYDDGALYLTAGDLLDLDVRGGDRVEIALSDPPAGCPDAFDARIVGRDAGAVAVARSGDDETPALSADDEDCIEEGGDLTATVRAGGSFTVESNLRGPLPRLYFTGAPDVDEDETRVVMAGTIVTLAPGAAGLPAPDSVQVVPLSGNVLPVVVHLSRQPLDDDDGFGDLARQPIAMAGGPMKVPSGEEGEGAPEFVDARRILLVTPARLFTFDEGETDVGAVAAYR